MERTEGTTQRRDWSGAAVTALWILAYFVARGLLEMPLAPWLRVIVALVPVPAFALFLVTIIRGIGQMDELEQRIHLEALAVGFPLAMLLLMTPGLLQLAIPLSKEDWSYRHVWAYLPTFYFLGLFIARRRYQ